MHKNMDNLEVARLLHAVAAAYEVGGESRFRIRAYDTAAESVEHASREVKDLWEEEHLGDLPGIGANLSSHLAELFSTGSVKHFEEVFRQYPEAMFELLEIPGVGPKTALKLSLALGLKRAKGAIQKLRAAAAQGMIRTIEGFGEESERAILKGIEEVERREYRLLLPQATQLSQELIAYMRQAKSVLRIDPLGSLRRRSATVGDIDIAIATNDAKQVIDHFKKFPETKKILAAGGNTARLIHRNGRQIDIKTQVPRRYGSLLQHFTGSKAHNIHLREIAISQGKSLSEHGIKVKGRLLEYPNEEAFYRALGMNWVPPELREDQGEIEAASANTLPKLVEAHEVKGDFHVHTNYPWQSSHDTGADDAKVLVEQARALGYDYIGIGDHNPATSSYNRKQLMREVARRTEYIQKIKESYENNHEKRKITIWNALEVDILPDGQLALPDEALHLLDYCVVSIHSSMHLPKRAMTDRIIKGLSHPKALILGHPSGRLLNKREGFEVDWERVMRFAKERGKFLEINAWPLRLDLPDTLVREAIRIGVQLVINSDAHAASQMELIHFGVDVARRGWSQASDILNTRPLAEVKEALLNRK